MAQDALTMARESIINRLTALQDTRKKIDGEVLAIMTELAGFDAAVKAMQDEAKDIAQVPSHAPANAQCTLKRKGEAYPRTCPVCGLGPCKWPNAGK